MIKYLLLASVFFAVAGYAIKSNAVDACVEKGYMVSYCEGELN